VVVRGGHLGGRSVASSGDDFRFGGHRHRWDRNWDPGGDGGGSDGQNQLRLSNENPSTGWWGYIVVPRLVWSSLIYWVHMVRVVWSNWVGWVYTERTPMLSIDII
jgi:hypothetical protein